MNIKTTKRRIIENKPLKVLIMALLAIALIFYFIAFFSKGVEFDDAFLKKQVVVTDTHYMGKNMYGNIHITVKGLKNVHRSAEVVYRLPNDINRQYIVNFKDPKDWDAGMENIMDKDGNIIFEGGFRKDIGILFDKDGQFLTEYKIMIAPSIKSPYDDDYKVLLKDVAGFVYSTKDTIRGKYEYLFPALLLLVITFVDIRYPLFFFTLRHYMEVEDPRPSECYLTIQRASWVIYPIIALFLMIAAIN